MRSIATITIGQLIADGHLTMSDGYRTKQTELRGFGYRIIRVADVRDGEISLASPDYVSVEYERAIGEKTGREGDVLLTTKGTVGRVALVPKLDQPIVYSPQLCFFRVSDQSVLSRNYLRYWLKSTEFLQQALDRMNNTDMAPYINLADIRSVQVRLPPIGDQHTTATFLSSLDDKITANTELTVLLWAHLDAMFEQAVTREHTTLQLNEAVDFHNRKRVPLSAQEREQRPGQVPYYGATGVFGHVDSAIFHEPLVLVGEDGSVITDEGRPVVQYIWGPSWVNNHAHVLTGGSISTELLALALRRADIRHLVTGAVQPKISMGKLRTLTLDLPQGEPLRELEDMCARETALLRATVDESRTLVTLRNTLLPQLMSGKLRVRDAEKQVGEVV